MSKLTVSSGPLRANEAQSWTDEQIPHANQAGRREVAERAVKVAQEVVTKWADKMQPLWRRWRHTFYMLSGNTLDNVGPSDIHIPELHKILETATPRIEEALLERDPWFRVVGRSRMDQGRADTIAAYLDWQLDQSNFSTLVQPAARDMLVCQIAAVKTVWDRRTKRRLRRTFDQGTAGADGKVTYKVTKEWVDEVEYDGPVDRLVDPFDFIMDPKSTDPQTALYVGDRTLMSIDEIERYGTMFGWMNLREVLEAKEGMSLSPDFQSMNKWTRDPTEKFATDARQTKSSNRPPLYEVVHLFLRSDVLNDDGQFEEIELVIVNGTTCCVARKNITDAQVRPYAIARAAKNGHELFGVGPMDNAVRLNQQLDRYSAILFRSAELGAMPMVFAGSDAELPDSLYKVRPFSVFKDVGDVKFTSVPDGITRSGPLIVSMLTRHIEETTGVFKIQQGQESTSGTATEATLSLQEANRRMRSWIRSVADMVRQVLILHHHYNRQYTCAKTTFRVMGKRAIALNREYLEIGPDTLMQDVDFEMVGLKSLSTYGLKAVGMQSWVNMNQAFIQSNPDRVDQLAFMHDSAREMIGTEEADRYVRVPEDPSKLISQEQENVALLQGAEVEIAEGDDDKKHMLALRGLFQEASDPKSKLDKRVRLNVIQHYLAHGYALERKQAQQQAAQQRQAMIAASIPQQQGTAPRPGGFATGGTPGQRAGENPGPADTRKVPKTGNERRTPSQMEAQSA